MTLGTDIVEDLNPLELLLLSELEESIGVHTERGEDDV